jgi:M6 family metalloprotease-like protein
MKPILIVFAACAAGAPWVRAAAVPETLSAFRTPATALTTQIVRTGAVERPQPPYLGCSVVAGTKGRLTVDAVDGDSPAAQAGLQRDDVLRKADQRTLKTKDDLTDWLRTRAPGDTARLIVERNRKSLDLVVQLGAPSRPLKLGSKRTTLGARLTDPKQGEGALVESVTTNSAAARAGFKAGDLLLKLDGDIISSRNAVREAFDYKQPGDAVKFTLLRNGEEMDVEARLTAATEDPATANLPRRLWRKPVYRLGLVLVEYPDVKHNALVTSNDWWQFAFSLGSYTNRTNATGQDVHGSMQDYYHEVSAGAFRLEGRVFDWIEATNKRAEYAQGTNMFNKSVLLGEVLDRLEERDGKDALEDCDGLLFIHAGGRVSTANRGSLYWPHQGAFQHRRKRWNYFICPEGGKNMAGISVFCHEFGHMLGLPDLYARPENPGSEGLGSWCVMSNETGGGRPQHFSAWCKEQLGWLHPAVIDPAVKQRLVLAPVEGSTNECFKVLVRPDGSEHLLLENRRRVGFDRSLSGDGLLIWRVVAGRPILEESHGIEGAAGPRVFAASVPYPSRSNHAFTPETTPSSRSLLGGGARVSITDIRELADGRVTFQLGYDFQ